MSFRSINALRLGLVRGSFIRPPMTRMPITTKYKKPIALPFTIHNSPLTTRYYSSSVKHETSKISSLAFNPATIQAAKAEPKPSKIRELTKKYGAVGILVYLGVGCVDLGITLGVIQFAGLDKVKALEKGVMDVVYSAGEKIGIQRKPAADNETPLEDNQSEEDSSNPSLMSVFILAYGIHKTLLLPVRVGITAAITPAIVRKLHQMGWARYFPRLLGPSPVLIKKP